LGGPRNRSPSITLMNPIQEDPSAATKAHANNSKALKHHCHHSHSSKSNKAAAAGIIVDSKRHCSKTNPQPVAADRYTPDLRHSRDVTQVIHFSGYDPSFNGVHAAKQNFQQKIIPKINNKKCAEIDYCQDDDNQIFTSTSSS
jgi:hypothetical protein